MDAPSLPSSFYLACKAAFPVTNPVNVEALHRARVFETMTGKTINAFQKEKEKEKETTVKAEVSQLCRAVGRTCFIFFGREEPCKDF